MQEQQQIEEYQPKDTNESLIPLYKQSVEYFRNHFCTEFGPYQHYFSLYHPALIKKNEPQYCQGISKNNRNNLSIQRQIKYLRRVVNQDCGSTLVKENLKEYSYQSYHRRGNVSFEWNGTLFWAEESRVMMTRIDSVIKIHQHSIKQIEMAQVSQVVDLHELIYELLLLGQTMIIRSARIVFIFDLKSLEIIEKYGFEHEITALWTYQFKVNTILFVSLFDGSQSILHKIDLSTKIQEKTLLKGSEIVHSGWCFTKNQFLLCSKQGVQLFDNRHKRVQNLYSAKRNTHVFTGIPLDSPSISINAFSLSESFSVNLFDFRKPQQPFQKIIHYCEESPPTILQLFDPNKNKRQFLSDPDPYNQKICPLLVASSPYRSGSSLFTELKNPDWSQNKKSSVKHFQLLFDAGKTDHNYHPRSLTPLNIKGHTCFFHVDNFYGINVQILKKTNSQYFERVCFSKPSEPQRQANEQWFKKYTMKTMIKGQQKDYWKNELQQQQGLQLQDNNFQKLYLRFADLKQFYHELHKQSKSRSILKTICKQQKQLKKYLFKERNMVNSVSLQTTLGTNIEDINTPTILGQDCLTYAQLIELNDLW